ncbi:mutator protein [Hordeum vulgare]|nr:mutator protein [Hordeum vulgare]
MSTDSEGCRQQMEALIGMSPPEPEAEDGGKNDRVPAGAPFTWIAANFAHCPEDANDEVIQTYDRVYMWYVISRTIFADGSGKNPQWMWLKALTVFDNKFSWGSAALAYLYRQLDEACHREVTFKAWDDHDNPVRLPIWAYKWDTVSEVTSDVNILYKQYTNEMDSLTAEQEDILEDPTSFDELAHGEYDKLIHEGYQTPFAPVLNFVCKEINKQADETEAILEA